MGLKLIVVGQQHEKLGLAQSLKGLVQISPAAHPKKLLHGSPLEQRFPGVPSIGCIGMAYQTGMVEQGVGVIAFTGGGTAAAKGFWKVRVRISWSETWRMSLYTCFALLPLSAPRI